MCQGHKAMAHPSFFLPTFSPQAPLSSQCLLSVSVWGGEQGGDKPTLGVPGWEAMGRGGPALILLTCTGGWVLPTSPPG